MASAENVSAFVKGVQDTTPRSGTENVSPLLSARSEVLSRLAAPDADLPYTLEGTVMSMDLIKELYSVWSDSLGPVRVGMILPVVQKEMSSYTDMYEILRESMQKYGQRVPVYVAYPGKVQGMIANGPMLADGIHRVAIADELGWETMITCDDHKSSWHEWNESLAGQQYKHHWDTRLGMRR